MTTDKKDSVSVNETLPHYIQDIFEGGSECVARISTDNRIISVNRNFAELIGMSVDDLADTSWLDIVFEADRDIARQTYNIMLESGRAETILRCYQNAEDSFFSKLVLVRGLPTDPGRNQTYLFLSNLSEGNKNPERDTSLRIAGVNDEDIVSIALAKTYRALRVLNDCNDALLRVNDEEELYQAVCDAVVRTGGYRYAWIGVPRDNEQKSIEPLASTGIDHDDFFSHKLTWDDSKWGNGPLGSAIKTGEPSIINNIFEHEMTKPWRPKAVSMGFIAMVSLPLKIDDKTVGVLSIYTPNKEAFDEEETKLLLRLANNLSYGIESIRDQKIKTMSDTQMDLENTAFQLSQTELSLQEYLDNLILKLEAKDEGVRGSILLMDESGKHLKHCSSPSLSSTYTEAVDGIEVGPSAGSCGTAAYTNRNVFVSDVRSDEKWKRFSSAAQEEGLLACHSVPIRSPDGKVLGTFALYFKSVRSLDVYEITTLQRLANILGGVIGNSNYSEALKESQERFQLLSLATHDGVYDWDIKSNRVWRNEAYNKLYGTHDDSVGNIDWRLENILPEQREDIQKKLDNKFDNKFSLWMEEYSYQKVSGDYATVMDRGYIIYDHEDVPVRMIGSLSDITDRKQSDKVIRESESRFRRLYDDSPSMFFTLSPDGEIISANRYGAEHLGYAVGDLINQSISDICEDKDISVIKGKLANCVSTPDALQRGEIRFKHKYNDVIWVRATMRLISTNEKAAQILVTCEDISETKLLSEQLEYQAKHDPLTGLINRGEFERRLRRIIKYQGDSLEEEHALCYLDLDQFKVINDTSGHVAGDEMIRELSYVLSGVVRKRDTIARIGGDEFAILMEHCSLKQATRVANELLKAVDEFKFYWEGKQFSVGVSIGVVPIKFGDGSVQDILSVADAACFAAKDAGRNRMHVYKEDDDKFTRRQDEMEWVARINEALTKQQFCLAFQAIQYIGDKEQKQGKHYELLIRMKDENGDIIPPGVFLPSAERYNLAAKIDRWVVDTIFEHLIQNPDELDQLNICAINLSGHTFSDPEFLTMLQQRFKAGEIPAEKICFEITETAAVTDLGNAIQFMQRLKALGCKFALDDFGTGLSSFNYLKNLPVDYLKIDGSFIRDITSNPIDQAMVRSINDVGKVMGKEIIAEFVENDEIIQVLKEIGVDFAQGYGIHKPELLDIKII